MYIFIDVNPWFIFMEKKLYSNLFKMAFAFLSLLACPLGNTYAQADTAFWFAAPYIAKSGWGGRFADRPVVIRITTLNQGAKIIIQQPAGGGMPIQSMAIPANTTKRVDISSWLSSIETHPPNTILNYGIKITSDVPVLAYYQVESFVSGGTTSPPDSRCSPELFNLKGRLALGTDFMIPSQFHYHNDTVSSSATDDSRNSFLVVATENNTHITITPSHAIVGHAAGLPFTIQMDKGQTYAVVARYATPGSHLQGSKVVSDKPVAITVSDDHIEVIGGDLAGDQIVSNGILGSEYVVLNGKLDSGDVPPGSVQDYVFITATENGTQISINGNNMANLNVGESYSFGLNGADAAYIVANHRVSVWHVSGISAQAGASEVPRLNCAGSQSVSFVRTLVGPLLINIVVPNGGESGFTLNGNAGIITSNLFAPVPGTNGNWLYCRLDINDLLANTYPYESIIRIDNQAAQFQLSVVNGCKNPNLYWGANLSYFSAYAAAGNSSGNLLGPDTSLCSGHSIILNATTSGASGYQWSTGETTATISVDTPGTYWVHVDGDFCVQNDTIHVGEREIPPLDLGNDTTICAGKKIVLSASVASGGNVLWNTGATNASIIVQDSGNYWVKINYPACGNVSDTIAVGLMHCDCYVGIPNVFSPNGDGRNDVFLPVIGSGCAIQYYDLKIYNRYGQLVFRSRNPEIGWDGKQLGKNADLDVYMYYLIYKEGMNDVKVIRKGDLTLIR